MYNSQLAIILYFPYYKHLTQLCSWIRPILRHSNRCLDKLHARLSLLCAELVGITSVVPDCIYSFSVEENGCSNR